MMLGEAVAKANEAGRFGLILYTIPNFPDPEVYARTLKLLDSRAAVSIVETTIPVGQGFSDHANDTIINAHLQAVQHDSLPARPEKPTLCVLYKGSLENSDLESFDQVLGETRDQFEGLILEWSEDDEGPWVRSANSHQVELVQCIGPWMDEDKIRSALDLAIDTALVYLMSAPMTGATLFSTEELSQCVAIAKSIRPDIKIAAGFGIRTAQDIEKLKAVEGLDGVIIGTAFLESMGQGYAAAERFLDAVEPGLSL